MHIQPTDALAIEVVSFDKLQELVMLSHIRAGQHLQKGKYFCPIAQRAASEFADDERVSEY